MQLKEKKEKKKNLFENDRGQTTQSVWFFCMFQNVQVLSASQCSQVRPS